MQITPAYTPARDSLINVRMAEHVMNFADSNGASTVARSATTFVERAQADLVLAGNAGADARQAQQYLSVAQTQLQQLATASGRSGSASDMITSVNGALRQADEAVAQLFVQQGGDAVELGHGC